MNEIVIRDVLRLADAKLSMELWQRQKNGEQIFKSDYDHDERIAHYEARMNRYAGYVAKHIKSGTGIDISRVIAVIKVLISFLPKELQNIIISAIKKILGEILGL